VGAGRRLALVLTIRGLIEVPDTGWRPMEQFSSQVVHSISSEKSLALVMDLTKETFGPEKSI